MLYLLHFDPPLKHAQHYLGWTTPERLAHRLRQHSIGRGARLVDEALRHGCLVRLARLWEDGTPTEERRLKRFAKLKTLCPLCNNAEIEGEAATFMPLTAGPRHEATPPVPQLGKGIKPMNALAQAGNLGRIALAIVAALTSTGIIPGGEETVAAIVALYAAVSGGSHLATDRRNGH